MLKFIKGLILKDRPSHPLGKGLIDGIKKFFGGIFKKKAKPVEKK